MLWFAGGVIAGGALRVARVAAVWWRTCVAHHTACSVHPFRTWMQVPNLVHHQSHARTRTSRTSAALSAPLRSKACSSAMSPS